MTTADRQALAKQIKELALAYRHCNDWPILKYHELAAAVDALAAVQEPTGGVGEPREQFMVKVRKPDGGHTVWPTQPGRTQEFTAIATTYPGTACGTAMAYATASRDTQEADARNGALEVSQICQPNGLMFDALGKPRTRYVRVSFDGAHCAMSPREAEEYKRAERENTEGEGSVYTYTDVYLSEREFDDLPEFDGF